MNALDLKESLTAWYKPLTGETGADKVKRNVGWMTCEQWANGTTQDTSSWESIMKDMCYSQTK